MTTQNDRKQCDCTPVCNCSCRAGCTCSCASAASRQVEAK
jgi:hypothetical protein